MIIEIKIENNTILKVLFLIFTNVKRYIKMEIKGINK